MGGSMLGGAVLGPVGAIAGAIGGAVVGSRAGAAATDGVCDAIDSTGSHICEDCKAAAASRPAGYQNWGGGRLGTGSEPPTAPTAPTAAPQGTVASQPSIGDKISETASVAGERLSDAASVVGENLSSMGSWLKKSVSSVAGSENPDSAGSGGGSKAKNSQKWRAFEGTGHVLGSTEEQPSRSMAAEAAMRRSSQAAGYGGYAQQAQNAQPSPSQQITDDEALARQLQEQFLREDQQR